MTKSAGKAIDAKRWFVRGRVQGVGYRYFAQRAAVELGPSRSCPGSTYRPRSGTPAASRSGIRIYGPASRSSARRSPAPPIAFHAMLTALSPGMFGHQGVLPAMPAPMGSRVLRIGVHRDWL
jgi:hypothetical protein